MKKLVAMVLTLALALTLGAPALADGEESSLLIHDGTGVSAVFQDQSGQGWRYESAANTLTLDGFRGGFISFGLYDQAPTIVLADGSVNTVTIGDATSDASRYAPDGAVSSQGGLVIRGGGSLTVTGGIFTFSDLTIQGGTVSTTGQELRGGQGSCGSRYGLEAGTLTVTGGTITATSKGTTEAGSTFPAEPISCTGFSMSGGTLTAQGGESGIPLICESGSFTGGTLILDGSALALQNFTLGDGVSAAGGASASDHATLKVSSSVSEYDPSLTLTVFVHASRPANYVVLTGPGSAAPQPPAQPEETPAPAANIAYATSYSILVDGQAVAFDAYALRDASGNDTNYLKLRDVAHVLNGTAAQFNVGWDQSAQAIAITTGTAYATPNGSEMSTPFTGDQTYVPNAAAVLVDGVDAGLEAISIYDAAGNGYTYFKLRDLGDALGFGVDWDQAAGAIVINTKG